MAKVNKRKPVEPKVEYVSEEGFTLKFTDFGYPEHLIEVSDMDFNGAQGEALAIIESSPYGPLLSCIERLDVDEATCIVTYMHQLLLDEFEEGNFHKYEN